MEDDIDIYADLPSFGTKCSETCESNNEQITVGERSKLKNQIEELTAKLEKFQKLNENLEANLFSLLKTAKAEIARKDKMIAELRKKLDDATFKRGTFSRIDDSAIDKTAVGESLSNKRRKSSNFCLSERRSDIETASADYVHEQAKDQRNKPTLIPVTVFGERLMKRMLDEQTTEAKDKQSSRLGMDSNANRNTDCYMIESDKENGSMIDGDFGETKEIRSFTAAQYNGNEHSKNPLTTSKNTGKDLRSNGKNEIHSRPHRNSILTEDYTGKRACEDVNGHASVKRLKSSGEECSSGSREKEACGNVVLENNENSSMPRHRNFESTASSYEKRTRTVRDSNLKSSRDSNIDSKKRGCLIGDANKREERSSSKDKNDVQRDKRDTAERSSKRRDKGERDTDNWSIVVFEKGDYRTSHGDYRRTKQREHMRIDDHRPRAKSTSYSKYLREEKYNRSQYNKHTSYNERFEKRYDFRGSDADKVKQTKKDSNNVRCMTKAFDVGQVPMDDGKVGDAKRNNHCTEYQSWKPKTVAEKPDKGGRKHDECNENSHRKLNTERSVPSRNSEVSRDRAMEGVGRYVVSENEYAVDEENLTKLEDGEILSTPNNSPQKTVELEGSKDERNTLREPIFSSKVDGTSITSLNRDIANVETMEAQLLPCPTTSITTSPNQNNFENIESAENVENIERYIRDYASTCDKACEGISTASDVIRALEDSAANELPKVEDITVLGDICDDEQVIEDRRTPTSSVDEIVSAVKYCEREEVTRCAVTKNTFVPCNSESKHDRRDMQCAKDNLSPDEHDGLNSTRSNSSEGAPDEAKISTRGSLPEQPVLSSAETNTKGISGRNSEGEQERNNRNNAMNAATTKLECQNSRLVTEAKNEKEMVTLTSGGNETAQCHSDDTNARDTCTNVQGKIVVFARRKKPVCLANSNANMTVVINNECDVKCRFI